MQYLAGIFKFVTSDPGEDAEVVDLRTIRMPRKPGQATFRPTQLKRLKLGSIGRGKMERRRGGGRDWGWFQRIMGRI